MPVKESVLDLFSNDTNQLDFIQSDDKRIIVTAPAGCGKTTAMVGKIAYELINNRIHSHKKILAMSYSVNASLHIRDAIEELLPQFVEDDKRYIDRVDVANYHSFAMRLLKKHGYILSAEFKDISNFEITDDNDRRLSHILNGNQLDYIQTFNEKLKDSEISFDDINTYWDEICESLIENHTITYNGMIVSAIILLEKDAIRTFYQQYYSLLIIDEFQDTNMLGYLFISQLFSDNRVIFLGDDVQKIYTFLGAIRNIFGLVTENEFAKVISFSTNYRFKENDDMRNLDSLLRGYAEEYNYCGVNAKIYANELKSDEGETEFIIQGIKNIVERSEKTVAILVGAGWQGESIATALSKEGIPYFNALFGDTDSEQNEFYYIAKEELYNTVNGRATKSILVKWLKAISKRIDEVKCTSKKQFVFESLFKLLETLCIESLKWQLTTQERYEEILTILSNKGLRHMMDYLDERVILTTIHSAKGLEWDYVIIPGNNAHIFPNNYCCKPCENNCSLNTGSNSCQFRFTDAMKRKYTEQLSVFYVAVTRAKKNVFFTYNTGMNKWHYPKKRSCLLGLQGIERIEFHWKDVIG